MQLAGVLGPSLVMKCSCPCSCSGKAAIIAVASWATEFQLVCMYKQFCLLPCQVEGSARIRGVRIRGVWVYYRTLWLVVVVWINRKNWRFFTGTRNWLPLRIKGQKSDGRLQIWCSIQLSLHKEPPEVGLVQKLTGSLY